MAADRLPDPEPQNLTEGMPPELVRALRDPTIRLPQDDYKLADGRPLWDHLQEWRNAPSGTASGGPVSAAVPPAEPPEENESDRMLLVALGMLLSWRVVRYEENMGGGWFSASEFGTHPIRADEVRRLYAKESEARRGF